MAAQVLQRKRGFPNSTPDLSLISNAVKLRCSLWSDLFWWLRATY